MNLQTLYPDFREFLRLLNESDVEYLLIGGYAVGYYGYVRATVDMDVWVAVSPENALRVQEALASFGFGNDARQVNLEPGTIYRLGIPPYRIEMTTSIDGVSFSECYEKRIVTEIDGLEIPIIDLTSLRKNKAASGRPKDLADLAGLPKAED